MSSTIPSLGCKISLISNSEIRYEGILSTMNPSESTIALQWVKTLGTEGRKSPDIPPSSEVYDCITFNGQDIKELTVFEDAEKQTSLLFSDPAIISTNQRPPDTPCNPGHAWYDDASWQDRDASYSYHYNECSESWNSEATTQQLDSDFYGNLPYDYYGHVAGWDQPLKPGAKENGAYNWSPGDAKWDGVGEHLKEVATEER